MKRVLSVALAAVLLPSLVGAQTPERRLMTVDDAIALRDVDDPNISPDGEWVAYHVATRDLAGDDTNEDIWMTSWDGARTVRLTYTDKQKESTPRWSPDNQSLAFLSSRDCEYETDQVWVLNRLGGEAERVTDLKGGVEDYAWSPDGKRLALVVADPDPDAPDPKAKDDKKTDKPIHITRFQFKQDRVGYLKNLHSHLFVFDLQTRKVEQLTSGETDDVFPAWSPDGAAIAFVTKRGADPDRHANWDIYTVEPKAGAQPRQVTTFEGGDCDPDWSSRPTWSPDGKTIAYVRGGDPKRIYYATFQLAVVPAAGGQARLLAEKLDRNSYNPIWAPDGKSVYGLLEDDGNIHFARFPLDGAAVERVVAGRRSVSWFDVNRQGKIAILDSTPTEPYEVFALDGGRPRKLSHQNDALLATLNLASTEEIRFKSKDGTEVHGFLVKPFGFDPSKKYPTILRIHGGPVSQFANEFMYDFQVFAASGYVVVCCNPRGSSGRGEPYAHAIWADWGNKDVEDVLAAVDYTVGAGVSDPNRMGIGGWSYGGMLTNYTIARDTRFRAAVSGASISNILAGYGTDQYIREYELELGVPWKNPEVWARVSQPFLKADRIATPTLFLCGESDFNVPLLNSEQMYQALRSRGVATELVIYPGQFHRITTPSYLKDRLERYVGWYDRYLKAD